VHFDSYGLSTCWWLSVLWAEEIPNYISSVLCKFHGWPWMQVWGWFNPSPKPFPLVSLLQCNLRPYVVDTVINERSKRCSRTTTEWTVNRSTCCLSPVTKARRRIININIYAKGEGLGEGLNHPQTCIQGHQWNLHKTCFSCVNFFFFCFLTIARRTIISGSSGQIFANFSPNESVLGADHRSGPLFPIS